MLTLFSRSQWHFEMSKIWFHALSSEKVDVFSPNLQRYIVGKREIEDLILVTLT